MSTTCYLGPRFLEFNMPNGTHMDAHKIYDLSFVNFKSVFLTWSPVLLICYMLRAALIRHWLDACKDEKAVHWIRTQVSSYSWQSVIDDRANEADVSTAAPDRSAVLCC